MINWIEGTTGALYTTTDIENIEIEGCLNPTIILRYKNHNEYKIGTFKDIKKAEIQLRILKKVIGEQNIHKIKDCE